jgi:hypothetical protein
MPSTPRWRGATVTTASEQRIDERRDGRPLRNDDQYAKEHHHEDDRRQPELLPLTHELPKVTKKLEHQKGFSKLSLLG